MKFNVTDTSWKLLYLLYQRREINEFNIRLEFRFCRSTVRHFILFARNGILQERKSYFIRISMLLVTLWNMNDSNPRLSLLEWIICVREREWERDGGRWKMAEVMATISRSLHENGLETCQPSPSVYDCTCCNGAIEKAHPDMCARLSNASPIRMLFILEPHSRYLKRSSNYSAICNKGNSSLIIILIYIWNFRISLTYIS